ncbi:phosphodiesterase [Gluconacetobacter liquefaciens]|nr:phosphodiesterase [Gluconacetobacter liquefaciens]
MTMNIVDRIYDLFAEFGGQDYGEDVSQLDHALQCACLAQREGAPDTIVAAALLHDIGQFIDHAGTQAEGSGTDGHHEHRGGALLQPYFPPSVIAPIVMHVDAKRYLCAREPGYREGLSSASELSLRLQGGPFTPDEATDFEKNPYFHEAIQVRRYDDAGKMKDMEVPSLESYRGLLTGLANPDTYVAVS